MGYNKWVESEVCVAVFSLQIACKPMVSVPNTFSDENLILVKYVFSVFFLLIEEQLVKNKRYDRT